MIIMQFSLLIPMEQVSAILSEEIADTPNKLTGWRLYTRAVTKL